VFIRYVARIVPCLCVCDKEREKMCVRERVCVIEREREDVCSSDVWHESCRAYVCVIKRERLGRKMCVRVFE